jgi:phospholipid transport system substrate-binding protein
MTDTVFPISATTRPGVRQHFRRRLAAAALLAGALIASSVQAEQASPDGVVRTYQAGLLSVMKQGKALGYDGRAAKLVPIVEAAFDLPFLARRAAGPHWSKMNPDQRKRYVAVFRRLSIAQHAGRFKGFGGESFNVVGTSDPGRGYKLVKTVLTTGKGERISIDYLLGQRGGRWQVVDVFTKGTISEVATRRSEFSAILNEQGADALIQAIEGKIKREKTG